MENVFRPEIQLNEQYDLKGSQVNRTVSSDNPEIAKKDLDFRQKIKLGSSRKALVLEQIEKDTLWLQTRNVIDYSLLVGIHFSTTELLDNVKKKNIKKFHFLFFIIIF
jgi:1-phosphatidylinositol-4-phosphate 5-kinase